MLSPDLELCRRDRREREREKEKEWEREKEREYIVLFYIHPIPELHSIHVNVYTLTKVFKWTNIYGFCCYKFYVLDFAFLFIIIS